MLNGSKMWITNGSFADVLVVFAATDRELGARGGITAFIVEKDFPGFKVGKVEPKMGLRASHTASLFFEDCRVPAANVLGQVGQGFAIAMQTLDIGRCGLGASSLGSAKEAYELALKLCGRAPAVRPADRRFPGHPVQAGRYGGAKSTPWSRSSTTAPARLIAAKAPRSNSSIVKLYCTEAASQVIDEAIQIHGGMGFSRELPLERMYRDARVTRIFEGTNEIQRHVIAGELLKGVGHKIKLY